jgi:hypothetical protein
MLSSDSKSIFFILSQRIYSISLLTVDFPEPAGPCIKSEFLFFSSRKWSISCKMSSPSYVGCYYSFKFSSIILPFMGM